MKHRANIIVDLYRIRFYIKNNSSLYDKKYSSYVYMMKNSIIGLIVKIEFLLIAVDSMNSCELRHFTITLSGNFSAEMIKVVLETT